jgi:tRNA(fMet)-specific endonuclease VapC
MTAAVIDTNIVSFIIKADSRAALYKAHMEHRDWILSFMSFAELHRWVIKWHWKTPRLNKLDNYLSTYYTIHHEDEVLCRKWAEIREECRKKGKAIDTDDAWIAATALVLDLPLITHNYKDFCHVEGLEVISVGVSES